MVQIKSSRHCRILSVPLEKSHLIPKGYLLPIESNAINFSLAQKCLSAFNTPETGAGSGLRAVDPC